LIEFPFDRFFQENEVLRKKNSKKIQEKASAEEVEVLNQGLSCDWTTQTEEAATERKCSTNGQFCW